MQVLRVADGLWRWTAPHPEWVPGGIGPLAWPQDVGCVYFEAPDATVLIDPLAPPDGTRDAKRFWDALDRDVERRGLPVAVICTIRYHARSEAEVRRRYPALPGPPTGAVTIALGDPHDEVVVHLPDHRALVVGDILVGGDVPDAAAAPLALCPASWYGSGTAERRWYRESAAEALRPLLALEVERVLVSHGTPVLVGGADALAGALAHHDGDGSRRAEDQPGR